MSELHLLVLSVALAFVMLMTASGMRTRGNARVALGNRDDVLPPSPAAERADRAAKNMLENLLLFACVLLAARAAGAPSSKLVVGAHLFFWSRLAYFFIYLAGIKVVRTLAWLVGVVAVGMIGLAAF